MGELDPLLRDFPDRIQTERLLLRGPQIGDGHHINAAILESLDALKPWTPWAQVAPSLEASELVVRQNCISWLERKELYFFGFYNQQFVQSIGLRNIDWDVPKFEVGYWQRTSASGQGLMTESLVALTTLALERFDAKRVQIRCHSGNQRSRRVAERAGFTLEGILKHDSRWIDGTLRDTCVYSLVRENSPKSTPPQPPNGAIPTPQGVK